MVPILTFSAISSFCWSVSGGRFFDLWPVEHELEQGVQADHCGRRLFSSSPVQGLQLVLAHSGKVHWGWPATEHVSLTWLQPTHGPQAWASENDINPEYSKLEMLYSETENMLKRPNICQRIGWFQYIECIVNISGDTGISEIFRALCKKIRF